MTIPGGDFRHDPRDAGLPVWAKRDTGPLNTYVPGPISSEPLVNSYHGDVRLIVSGLIFAAIIVYVLVKEQVGAIGTALGLVLLWSLYGVPVWLRGRIGLRVDGSRAEVHGLLRAVSFEGADVATVKQEFAGRSPDVRLGLRDGRKVMVVTSRLEKGHSTLFEWLRRYAPDAVYDEKALNLRDMLVTRGLIGSPGEPWDGPTSRNEAAPPPLPEEHSDEGAVRLEGSPNDHHNEAATPRIPEEHRDEGAVRLEGPTPGTTQTLSSSDEVSPKQQGQTPPESEDR